MFQFGDQKMICPTKLAPISEPSLGTMTAAADRITVGGAVTVTFQRAVEAVHALMTLLLAGRTSTAGTEMVPKMGLIWPNFSKFKSEFPAKRN